MTGEVEEALTRARKHLQNATLEGLEAASALLDAALAMAGIDDSDPRTFAGEFRRSLDDLLAAVQTEDAFRFPNALADPLLEALDAEIERWQMRSLEDASGRPVLRAFLALRELLWQLGIRSTEAGPQKTDARGMKSAYGPAEASAAPNTEQNSPSTSPSPDLTRRPTRDRVQRFEVE